MQLTTLPGRHFRPARAYPIALDGLECLAQTISLLDDISDSPEVKCLVARCHALIELAAGPDAHLIYPEGA